MYRIIKPRGAGKTTEILHLAEENNAIVVCSNPRIYEKLAQMRGFNSDITFISYDEYLNKQYSSDTPILIDEIDGLMQKLKGHILGYSLSPED